MTQLIDKAAVVAEIERMLEAIANVSEQDVKDGDLGVIYAGQLLVLRNLVKFLDTLEVKEVVEYDDSDANAVLSEFGVEPDSSFANSLKDAFCKAFDLNESRRKARRAALQSKIDKLWVAGDTIYLQGADPEKVESFILSLAEYGYDAKDLLNEYKQTGKIMI